MNDRPCGITCIETECRQLVFVTRQTGTGDILYVSETNEPKYMDSFSDG